MLFKNVTLTNKINVGNYLPPTIYWTLHENWPNINGNFGGLGNTWVTGQYIQFSSVGVASVPSTLVFTDQNNNPTTFTWGTNNTNFAVLGGATGSVIFSGNYALILFSTSGNTNNPGFFTGTWQVTDTQGNATNALNMNYGVSNITMSSQVFGAYGTGGTFSGNLPVVGGNPPYTFSVPTIDAYAITQGQTYVFPNTDLNPSTGDFTVVVDPLGQHPPSGNGLTHIYCEVTDSTNNTTTGYIQFGYDYLGITAQYPDMGTYAPGDNVTTNQMQSRGIVPMHWAISGEPSGIFITPGLGQIYGTISNTATPGNYEILVTNTDSNGVTGTYIVKIAVS